MPEKSLYAVTLFNVWPSCLSKIVPFIFLPEFKVVIYWKVGVMDANKTALSRNSTSKSSFLSACKCFS
jgi:hypothetical protein